MVTVDCDWRKGLSYYHQQFFFFLHVLKKQQNFKEAVKHGDVCFR